MKEFLHHLLFPRESNNYRAKLLHHSTISYIIVALITLTFFFSFVEKNFASVLGISANISSDEMLALVNKERQNRGLSSLHMDGQLSYAASLKAQDMFANDYWAHTSPSGISPWVFIKTAGYEYLYAGENLARGFTTSNDVVKAWMDSPSHKDNILSPNYDEIGFAVSTGNLTGEETVLVVEMFGRRFAGSQEVNETQQLAVIPTLTPTVIPKPQIVAIQSEITPTVSGVARPTPTAIPVVSNQIAKQEQIVAAVKNQPLVNSGSFSKNISLLLLLLFVGVFITDIVIIERKKIVRVFSHTHTVDHVIFLTIITITIIVISQGKIL